jgi:predicted ATPase
MKLREITISNYLSLKEVMLSFGDLTVLVGKNGSGKTNILEALYRFFTDFNTIGGGISGNLNDYYWFDRDTTKPIRIVAKLELSEEDFEKIFQPLPENVRNAIKERFGDEGFLLSVSRLITSPQAGWKTEYLRLGNIQLVRDDKPIELEKFLSILIPEKATQDFTLYFFTPQEMAGNRLLIDKSRKVAYLSNPQIDLLAKIGVIKVSKETIGQNYRDWCDKQGFKLVERPPTQDEVTFLIQPVTQDLLNKILANITSVIKAKFKFIPAARDEKYTAGTRNPIIEDTLLSAQSTLSVSTTREDELKWSTFRNWVERFLGKRIEPNPRELLADENGLRVPARFLGGGEQEIFVLMWHLLGRDFIYGIEEPENHLHPEYLKKLFGFLKEISKDRQIIITTHSNLLVDKIDVRNNWIVRRDGKETKVQRLEDKEQLKLVLAELGLVPSDIYLKDFVLFVEGETEKEVILTLGEKLEEYGDIIERIAIIPIGGGKQLRNYLRIWLELINIVPIEYVILLDKHCEEDAISVAKELGIDINKFIILQKGSIEDYYPIELIVKALKDLFGIDIKKEDINTTKPMDKEMERILKEHNKLKKRWKVDIGKYIASELPEQEIPGEIKETFERAKKALRTVK